MLPIPKYLPPRAMQFPQTRLEAELPEDVFIKVVHKARVDPATLVSLALCSRGLWEQNGDASMFATCMLGVERHFETFGHERKKVPGQLLYLLFNSMSRLPQDLIPGYAERLTVLVHVSAPELVERIQTAAHLLETCTAWTAENSAVVDDSRAEQLGTVTIATSKAVALYMELNSELQTTVGKRENGVVVALKYAF